MQHCPSFCKPLPLPVIYLQLDTVCSVTDEGTLQDEQVLWHKPQKPDLLQRPASHPGTQGIKRARSESIVGLPDRSSRQQPAWQPWAAPQPGSQDGPPHIKPPSRPSSSTQSDRAPAMRQHHSGASSCSMPGAPPKAPSHDTPAPDGMERTEPDLTHVPKKRRQAIGRPHPWIIAAHKSTLGSHSVSGSPDSLPPAAHQQPPQRVWSGQPGLLALHRSPQLALGSRAFRAQALCRAL